ncbi:hypothetical protein [Nocardia sp. BMG51109]|uniref:hypothetical protein n=1 Tax=Nocardia sp. BMG51109 TaxID=1056816 RepID=UPI0004667A1B|nr:hypothetical protein [Nocardia sp. BMG51109]
MDALVLVVAVVAVFAVWRTVASWLTRRRTRRADLRRASMSRHPSATDRPVAVVADRPDPARPTLDTENVLFTALVTGLISRADYRAGITDLAHRCEPHAASGGE